MSDIETGQATKSQTTRSCNSLTAVAVEPILTPAVVGDEALPTWIKEEHVIEVKADGSKTKVIMQHFANGSVREIREPIVDAVKKASVTTSSLATSSAVVSGATNPTSNASETKHNCGERCNMKALAISCGITTLFAVIFWIILIVYPIPVWSSFATIFTIASIVLGIVMCSLCCCGNAKW